MLPELTYEELAAGLDRVALDLLGEAGVERPPVDAYLMARALGVAVACDDVQAGRARYVRLHDRRLRQPKPTILLRSEPRPERRQWALAHEIGEHAAHRVFALLGVDPREAAPNAREQVANSLAGRLLLPTAWLLSDGRACGWDLTVLKARYATASHELIARRMLECQPSIIISIFDEQRLVFRRSNMPGRVPPPTPAELTCWRGVHNGNLPLQTRDGPRIVRGWPIHEADWKREILRTEAEEIAFETCD